MESSFNPIIANIVKGLAYTENGGKPTQPKAGKTGEMKSIFQFTHDTWKIYSKQVSGQADLPLNTENETKVVYAKVGSWYDQLKKEGISDEEIPLKIASMWNAGEHRPDAYKQNFKGVNKKYGVAYDTPAYAKKVLGYVKQFQREGIQSDPIQSGKLPVAQAPINSPMMSTAPQNAQQAPPQATPGLLSPQMKQVRQV